MRIKCCVCSKRIKGTGRTLRTCVKCGRPACPSCLTEKHCSDCHPANADKAVINEYFRDKYTEETST